MSQSIDEILAGMEKQTWTVTDQLLQGYPERCGQFLDVVDKAYADRLEAMLRLAIEQRDAWIVSSGPAGDGSTDEEIIARANLKLISLSKNKE